MNAISESPVKSPTAVGKMRKILVWDAPTRLFHWLLAFSFAGAYLTAESESWRMVHVTLGYTMACLIGFRLLWGVVGSRHARFSSFVRGPRAIARYLGALLRRTPEHHIGHNPAGAIAIVGLLTLGSALCASGWVIYNDLAGGWVEELHEAMANIMLGIVGIHIAGVLLASWLHRDNLVGAMVTGRKAGKPEDGIRSAWHGVAVLLLAAVLAFWWMQWHSAPSPVAPAERSFSAKVAGPDQDEH